jgi:hypothetical protein
VFRQPDWRIKVIVPPGEVGGVENETPSTVAQSTHSLFGTPFLTPIIPCPPHSVKRTPQHFVMWQNCHHYIYKSLKHAY